MDYTKKHCLKWARNKNLDPISNTPIDPGSYTYNTLSKLCEKYDIVGTYKNPANYNTYEPNYRSLNDKPSSSSSSGSTNEPKKPDVKKAIFIPSDECDHIMSGHYTTSIVNGRIRRVRKERKPTVKKNANVHTL